MGSPVTVVSNFFIPQRFGAAPTIAVGAQTQGNVIPVAVGDTLEDGFLTIPYSDTVAASGGRPPYLFSILSGSLPAGLSLNVSTGTISGTPTTVGASTFTVQVVDTNGNLSHTTFTIAIRTKPLTAAQVNSGWIG